MGNLQSRVQDPEYANWVKAGLCLISLKTGLEGFAESKSKEFHQATLDHLVQTNIAVAGNSMCPNCDIKFKGNKSYASCQHVFCNNFLKAVIHVGVDPSLSLTFNKSNLANTNPQLWHCAPWELAKFFMSPGQKATQTGPAETDLSGIINFIDHCTVARSGILNTQNITEVRNARNTIMHSAELKLSNNECQTLTQTMIDLIEDPKVLAGLHDALDASKQIKEILSSNFVISLEDESKVLNDLGSEVRTISENLQTEIQDFKKQQHEGLQSHAEDIKGLSKYVKEKMDKIYTSFTLLEDRVGKDKALRKAMKSKMSELQRSLEQAKHDYQNMHREIDSLRQHVSGYERRVHLLEDRVNSTGNREVTESDCLKVRHYLLDSYESVCEDVSFSAIYEGPNDDVLKVPIGEIYSDIHILQYDRRGRGVRTELQSYKDIFVDNRGKKNKTIFVIGEAGAGKSTWCLNLINTWLKNERTATDQSKKANQHSEMKSNKCLEDAVSPFKYLFFARLRYVEGKASIKECIFSPILERLTSYKDIVDHILENYSEAVLILLDGYDEYNGNLSFEGLHQSTVLVTTRPWKFESFCSETISECKVDVELKLNGLSKQGVEHMIVKAIRILKNEDKDAIQIEQEKGKCLQDIRAAGLWETVKIPLILLIVMLTWLKNDSSLSISLTRNILGMLEVIFSRGEEKLPKVMLENIKKRYTKSVDDEIPSVFTEYPILSQYHCLILKLGELALKGLLHVNKSASLVFTQDLLVNFFPSEYLDFCFKLGLLSKDTVFHSLLEKKKVYVSFYHKLIQEFFAAVLIVANKNAYCEAKKWLHSIEDVLEWENVLLYACGLSPSTGSLLPRHLVCSTKNSVHQENATVVSSQTNQLCHPNDVHLERISVLTLKCMSEMFCSNQSEEPMYISDIRLKLNYYDAAVSESLIKLIGYNTQTLQSLYIGVGDEIHSANIELLAKSLQCTKRLQMLHVQSHTYNVAGMRLILSLPNLSQNMITTSQTTKAVIDIYQLSGLKYVSLSLIKCKTLLIRFLPKLQTLILSEIEADDEIRIENLHRLRSISMQHVAAKDLNIQKIPNLSEIYMWRVRTSEAINMTNVKCKILTLEAIETKNLGLGKIFDRTDPNLEKLVLAQIENITGYIKLTNVPRQQSLSVSDLTDTFTGMKIAVWSKIKYVRLCSVSFSAQWWNQLFDRICSKYLRVIELMYVNIGCVYLDFDMCTMLREIELGDVTMSLTSYASLCSSIPKLTQRNGLLVQQHRFGFKGCCIITDISLSSHCHSAAAIDDD